MTEPDKDVADWLAAGGLGLTYGTNLFRGPVQPVDVDGGIPHAAAFCLTTGGAPPMPYLGTTSSICRSMVQIRYRSEPLDFNGGQTKIRAIRDRCHLAAIVGYIDVRVRESEPNYLGQDAAGHSEWSVNVELVHRR